jgi:SNF2 family DNA or RNA helicase
MSEYAELNEFDLQLAKLKEQLKQLEEEREKKKKEIELSIPVKINIYEYRHYDNNFIFTAKPLRDDVKLALHKIPAYWNYSHQHTDGIWCIKWDKMGELKEVLSSLPNVETSIKKYVQEILDEYNNPIDLWVSVDESHLFVKHNIRVPAPYSFNSIPGNKYDVADRQFQFPKKESWRAYVVLNMLKESYDRNIEFKEGAYAFILQQVKEREELNILAKMAEYPPYMNIDLNGYKPLPFQSVGIRFAELANGDGRGMIWDEMGLGKTYQAIALSKILAQKEYSENPSKFKTLIICPAHLTHNWFRELKKYRGQDTRIIVFRGLTPSNVDTIRVIQKEYDYAIISYNLLGKRHKFSKDEPNSKGEVEKESVNLWVQLLNLARFDLAVFDEAHYMGNIKSGRVRWGQGSRSKACIRINGYSISK